MNISAFLVCSIYKALKQSLEQTVRARIPKIFWTFTFLDKQKQKVMSVRDKKDRAGKHDYSKRHTCIFCGKLVPKIARHLCSKTHSNEEAIARLPAVA